MPKPTTTENDTPSHKPGIGEQPLSLNVLVKWLGIMVSVVSGVITIVWFAATLKGDIITLQQEQAAGKTQVEMRNAQQDTDIDRLRVRADTTERAVADLNRKLDVAVAILERIDKKVGN